MCKILKDDIILLPINQKMEFFWDLSAGEEMNGKLKIKGQLKFYMQWPFILTIVLLVMDILVFTVNVKARGTGDRIPCSLYAHCGFHVFPQQSYDYE